MPQSLNRFSYGYNNPFKYHDPSGNAPQDFSKSDSWHFWNDLSNSKSYLGKAAGFTGLFFYEVGDMLTFGGVSRQDRTMTQYQRGEITGSEALWRTTANIAVSAPLLVAGLMTGGASVYVQVGIGAVAAGVQRFGTDNYEMSFEGRKSFSSAGQYALDIALGAAGGAIGGLANKFGGKVAQYLGGKISAAAKEGVEISKRGLQSLTKGARKASASVSEMLGKITSKFDELFSPQMVTPEGFSLSMNQVDDVARRETTMLSETLNDAPMGGGSKLTQVAYNETYDLASKAIKYRQNKNYWGDGNIAVLEYLDDLGNLQTKEFQSVSRMLSKNSPQRQAIGGGFGHSEEIMLDWLRNNPAYKPQRLFSEFEPCSGITPNCSALLKNALPDLPIYYSFEYGQGIGNKASQLLGLEAKREALKQIK